MIKSDNEREIVAREIAVFLRESDATRHASDGAPSVVSRALARRLRQIAAIAR